MRGTAVLTSTRAYNFKLCPKLKAVNICYIANEMTKLYVNVILVRGTQHMLNSDCAQGTVILAGTVRIMPILCTNQMTKSAEEV